MSDTYTNIATLSAPRYWTEFMGQASSDGWEEWWAAYSGGLDWDSEDAVDLRRSQVLDAVYDAWIDPDGRTAGVDGTWERCADDYRSLERLLPSCWVVTFTYDGEFDLVVDHAVYGHGGREDKDK